MASRLLDCLPELGSVRSLKFGVGQGTTLGTAFVVAATATERRLDRYQSHIDDLLRSTPKITAARIGS
jgi:hypothetical protein